jgi:hypothetical protein
VYTLPENKKGRKRGSTKRGGRRRRILALEATTRNQKEPAIEIEGERKILTLSLKPSIIKSEFFVFLQQE